MTNGKNRTLAFQIDEELFQRIKAHLERESARLGRKVTQREFVLNAIIGVLNMSEPMDVDEAGVSPCEAGLEDGSAQHGVAQVFQQVRQVCPLGGLHLLVREFPEILWVWGSSRSSHLLLSAKRKEAPRASRFRHGS